MKKKACWSVEKGRRKSCRKGEGEGFIWTTRGARTQFSRDRARPTGRFDGQEKSSDWLIRAGKKVVEAVGAHWSKELGPHWLPYVEVKEVTGNLAEGRGSIIGDDDVSDTQRAGRQRSC